MEILLRVEDGRRVDRDRPGLRCHVGDVAAQVEHCHTVRELVEAVAGVLGLDVDGGTTVSRAGFGPLDPRRTVTEAGLVSGDVLVIGRADADHANPTGGLRLVVASGPDAGRSIELGPGRRLVGRDPACDLALTDPQVSRHQLVVALGTDGEAVVEDLAADRNPARAGGEPVRTARPLRREEVVVVGASTVVLREGLRPRSSAGDDLGRIPFHRSPYFPTPVRPVVIEAIAQMPARP